MPTGLAVEAIDAIAGDGSIVRIRPVAGADAAALGALHAGASERSRYLRFFTANPAGAQAYAATLTEAGPDSGRIVLLAERDGAVVGVASAEPLGPGEAEIAFLVDDRCHGLGLGTLLLEHLAAAARARGIERFRADVLAENTGMLRVFADSGFAEVASRGGSVTDVVLGTALDERTLARISAREQRAGELSLAPMLSPRSVAVIGAGRTGGIGHQILRNLRDGGFTGDIYPVNPNATEICGLRAYPSVAALPRPVDLAVLAVPATSVRDTVADCCAAGIPALVITSAGLGEVGVAGRQLQAELVATARRHGTRIVGPNCLGIVSTAPGVQLNASFAPAMPLPGGLSLASQSGAVGIAVLDHATRSGLGIAEFVSLGNKADVSGNDLLLHWWRDPRTKVIGLYLESFGNPRKFARIARQVSADKPVVVVKGGRSAVGARAGASHTAAAATPDAVLDALFAQSGVLRVDTLPDLLDVARVLADQPLPRGRRLAVVGNAGGAGVLAVDAAEAAGLDVPALSERTRAGLVALAAGAAVENPVDLGAGATPDALEAAVRLLLGCGEVDAVLAVVAATRANNVERALAAVTTAAAARPGVPVLACVLGDPGGPTSMRAADLRVPVFGFPEPAVRALGRAAAYAAWRGRPRGTVPDLDRVDLPAARARTGAYLHRHPEGGWLPAVEAAALVRHFGVDVVRTVEATSAADAADAARLLGLPVALKTAAETVTHKSDVGGVRTGLRTEQEVRAAQQAVAAAVGDPRVLVQPMVAPGVEMVVGLVRDPRYGPVLMLGAGGVLTDLLGDRAFRGLPLTDTDVEEMTTSLRSARLLAGFRGAPPADAAALRDVVHRVALMADQIPEVAELDLNPVVVATSGLSVVDVKIRLAPPAAVPDPGVRRLS